MEMAGYDHRDALMQVLDAFADPALAHRIPCYGLAEAIDSGDPERVAAAIDAAAAATPADIESVVLGCTHYGLVREPIVAALQERTGREVAVFDSPEPVARQALRHSRAADRWPSPFVPCQTGLPCAMAFLTAVRSLIVTTFGRPGYLRRAIDAGASGFVVKDTPAAQLADAVRRVHAGLRVVDPTLATESLASGDNPLTSRETDVLRAALSGATVATIAAQVHLSAGTVRNHLSSAIGKTGASTRGEAAHIARDRGWI